MSSFQAPIDVLNSLKRSANKRKQDNLHIVYEVCAEMVELGHVDLLAAQVGRMSAARGGVAAQTIRNATGKDYQALIAAWRECVSKVSKRGKPSVNATGDEDLLRRIADPALRALFGTIISERNQLRGEVAVLRVNSNITIDMRPLAGRTHVGSDGDVIHVVTGSDTLAESERASLAKAVSPAFLEGEGWREDEAGRVLNSKGRALFDVGFTIALRKVLGVVK